MEIRRPFLDRRFAPTFVALGLGIVAVPIVATLLPAYDPGTGSLHFDSPRASPASDPVLVASAIPAVISALVAGTLWGGTVRAHIWAGFTGAVVTAWSMAVALLPVGAAILHQRLLIGVACIDSCRAIIDGADASSGLVPATIGFPIAVASAPLIFVTLLLGAGAWAWLIRRPGPTTATAPEAQ